MPSPAAPKAASASPTCSKPLSSSFPRPRDRPTAPSAPLIFDSWFDPYRGVIILARIMEGRMKLGQQIQLMSNGRTFEVEGIGFQSPKPVPTQELSAGEVGYLFANIKTISDAQIGDTITDAVNPAAEALPGFEQIKPMVFAGLYPVESSEHGVLRDALEKLRLNDSAFNFEPENSAALGFGFRCGFLGLLHLEIVQERLEREFEIDLITTAPASATASPSSTVKWWRWITPPSSPIQPRSSRSKNRSSTPPSSPARNSSARF